MLQVVGGFPESPLRGERAGREKEQERGREGAPLIKAMNGQGSLTRTSRVKREIPLSGVANGNNAGGEHARYAAAAAAALQKGEKRYGVCV